GCIGLADRGADVQLIHSVDQHDVAGDRFVDRLALEALGRKNLVDPPPYGHSGGAIDRDAVLSCTDPAAANAADADLADVAREVERADLKLQRAVRVFIAHRYVEQDRLEQRTHRATAA